MGDILGFHMTSSKFMICEVKKNGDTLKDDQIELLSKVTDAGGYAFVAKQVGSEILIEPYQKKVK